MAAKKTTTDTVRLTHANGATVTVSADKADRLTSAGSFSAAKAAASSTGTTSSK